MTQRAGKKIQGCHACDSPASFLLPCRCYSTLFKGGILGERLHGRLIEIVQRIDGDACGGHLKVEVRLISHLQNGGLTNVTELQT